MNFRVGDRLVGYEVMEVLGTGGMGEVYKVRNVISDRVEAMKVLLADLHSQRDLADRFLREIKVQARLTHPNIAGLHTAFEFEGKLLMILELVEGLTLSEILKRGRVPLADAAEYTCQALVALDYAHRQGVIHRDIKPANIMVTRDRRVKLMDFGIAKAVNDKTLTRTGSLIGSLHYMSPEQVQGLELDTRTDTYSLGVVLYEMVTGRKPFDGNSEFAIMKAHLEERPVPPNELDSAVPAALSTVILQALAKAPDARFQTAREFGEELEDVVLPDARGAGPESSAQAVKGPELADHVSLAGTAWEAQEALAPPRRGPTETSASGPEDRPLAPRGAGREEEPYTGILPPRQEERPRQASRPRLATITPPPEPREPGPRRQQTIWPAAAAGVLLAVATGFMLLRWLDGGEDAGVPAGLPSTEVTQAAPSANAPAPPADGPTATAPQQRAVTSPRSSPPVVRDPALPMEMPGSASRPITPASRPLSETAAAIKAPDKTMRPASAGSEQATVLKETVAAVPRQTPPMPDTPATKSSVLPTKVGSSATPSKLSATPIGSATSEASTPVASVPAPAAVKPEPPVAPPPDDRVYDFRDASLAQKPQLVHQVPAEYTPEARQARIEGRVLLEAEIWPDGRPHNIRVATSIGDAALDQNAVRALEKWRFAAGIKDGRPVKVKVPVAIAFRLF